MLPKVGVRQQYFDFKLILHRHNLSILILLYDLSDPYLLFWGTKCWIVKKRELKAISGKIVQHCNSITILLLSLENGDKIERSAKLSKCMGLLVQMYQGTKPVLPNMYILLSMADDNKSFALVNLVYEVKNDSIKLVILKTTLQSIATLLKTSKVGKRIWYTYFQAFNWFWWEMKMHIWWWRKMIANGTHVESSKLLMKVFFLK